MNFSISINRPLVFLCGPYEDLKQNNRNNRREILREYISKKPFRIEEDFSIYPVIIDSIFDDTKLTRFNLNISLVEEIIASIAFRTYIFQDTYSTSMELGLFSNSSSDNKIKVLFPNVGKTASGTFIKLSMDHNKDKVQVINYDNVVEKGFNLFPKNYVNPLGFIPESLKKMIITDSKELVNEAQNKRIYFIKGIIPNKINNIGFEVNDKDKLIFQLNPKFLFYLILSLKTFESFSKYTDEMILSLDFNQIYNEVISKVFEVFVENNGDSTYTSLISNIHFFNQKNIEIRVNQFHNLKETLRHMVSIAHIMVRESKENKNKNSNYILIGKSKPLSKKSMLKKLVKLEDLLDLNSQDYITIRSYNSNPQKYISKRKITINGKKRIIHAYSDNKYGLRLRELHHKFNLFLSKFEQHSNSFAYKKNTSIKNAISKHVTGLLFSKIDIKAFFPSITLSKFIKMFKVLIDKNLNSTYSNIFINAKHKKSKFDSMIDIRNIDQIFSVLFIENKLPLGFVTSPLISNLYLYLFDVHISDNLNITYTRYADDILLSIEDDDKEKMIIATQTISNLIRRHKLRLNYDKTKMYSLKKPNSHVKYLGLILSKSDNGSNKISVSKRFILETVKMKLNNFPTEVTNGREGFIKQISSSSYLKYCRSLKIRLDKQNQREYLI